jgi:hypothetical protein
MSERTDLPVDLGERLYEPPLVDSIYRDEQRRGFAITFVPSDDASSAPTELVFVAETAPDYRRILTFWNRIQELTVASGGIARIVHGGGGDYTFHFVDGSHRATADEPGFDGASEISDRLKQIADAAQIAFLDQSYPQAVPRSA